MKLLIATHKLTRGDGQGRVNYEIARHALDEGHQLTLLAAEVAQDLLDAGAKWLRTRAAVARPALLNVLLFARAVDRQLAAIAADHDVVLGNGFTLRHPHDVNACHFVHGTWLHSPVHEANLRSGPYAWYQQLYTRANARWEKQSYDRARYVVSISQLVKQELLQIGVSSEKIRVIYNGVDLDEFHPGCQPRQQLGLPEGAPLAIFVGDIRTSRKNLDTVLKALVAVPDLYLAVVGKLPGSPYPAMAERLGVAARVHFLGFRRDTPVLMRAADFCVFPSRYDTFGLVILEALASGLPTITTAACGAAELMTSDVGQVLEQTDDVAALAAAMRRWASDAGARQRAAPLAREIASAHSWTHMARAYLELFEEAHVTKRQGVAV